MVEMITQNGRDVVKEFDVIDIPIKDIVIGDRIRQDMGDVKGLADSIKEVGLLVPIAINADNRLVYGGRRIEAFKRLKRKTIKAVVLKSKKDELALKKAEEAENVQRKDFNWSEMDAARAAKQAAETAALQSGGKSRQQVAGGYSSIEGWEAVGYESASQARDVRLVVNKAKESEAGAKALALLDANVLTPHAAASMVKVLDQEVLEETLESISDDPQDVRETNEAAEQAVREYKAKKREDDKKRADYDQVKNYVQKWREILAITAYIRDEYGSTKRMLESDSVWSLKRNEQHLLNWYEILDEKIPELQKIKRQLGEFIDG